MGRADTAFLQNARDHCLPRSILLRRRRKTSSKALQRHLWKQVGWPTTRAGAHPVPYPALVPFHGNRGPSRAVVDDHSQCLLLKMLPALPAPRQNPQTKTPQNCPGHRLQSRWHPKTRAGSGRRPIEGLAPPLTVGQKKTPRIQPPEQGWLSSRCRACWLENQLQIQTEHQAPHRTVHAQSLHPGRARSE
jgi:hypothetical protein